MLQQTQEPQNDTHTETRHRKCPVLNQVTHRARQKQTPQTRTNTMSCARDPEW